MCYCDFRLGNLVTLYFTLISFIILFNHLIVHLIPKQWFELVIFSINPAEQISSL